MTVRASQVGNGHGLAQFVQVQRLANPLVNELIIGTKDKDHWNSLEPEQESRFLDYYTEPAVAWRSRSCSAPPAEHAPARTSANAAAQVRTELTSGSPSCCG